MSKKWWPIVYSKLLYKTGHYFLDMKYIYLSEIMTADSKNPNMQTISQILGKSIKNINLTIYMLAVSGCFGRILIRFSKFGWIRIRFRFSKFGRYPVWTSSLKPL